MISHRNRMFTGTVVAASAAALFLSVPVAQAGGSHHPPGGSRPPSSGSSELPLGKRGLPETRTTETIQRGVTLTTIVRGALDGTEFWTVELVVPAGSTDPDPDAPASALRDEVSAKQLAAELVGKGFAARAEQVITPALADYAGGELGWRVRVGQFTSLASADAVKAELTSAGYSGSSLFTGWDGESSRDAGPWVVQVLTIDPKKLRGKLDLSYGPDIEQRETTSALAAAAGATAGVNAGFFVLDPNNGAPGDPAGVGVFDGKLLSETVNGRPALVIRDDARGTQVERFTFTGSVSGRSTAGKHRTVKLALDGINRHPGKIRNCGGLGDQPTNLPLHDYTCTDDAEIVLFTPEYGAVTPTGAGAEVVLNRNGRVTQVHNTRGHAVPAGGRTIQATGDLVDDLLRIARPGTRLTIKASLVDAKHRRVGLSSRESIVNGGPELVRNGRVHVTVNADGFVRVEDPSWYYGWAHKRNPRTFAGVDKQGRTLLVTADGRNVESFGLSIAETGAVAKSLGMVEGLNLDGGGSTTLVVDGRVANQPSDSAGERPVGDALLILPARGHGKR